MAWNSDGPPRRSAESFVQAPKMATGASENKYFQIFINSNDFDNILRMWTKFNDIFKFHQIRKDLIKI